MHPPRRKKHTKHPRGGYSEDTQIRAGDNGGSARCYQAIFVPSTALASPGYDGQPAVYLYIAALEVNVLNCRIPGGR
jgi:hypothetical protein